MSDETVDPEEVSCMILDRNREMTDEEQLAFLMHRFNLDWDTVETMPAFIEHCKLLQCRDSKK